MSAPVWPPMVWVGGAPGAGKSTLAWALSRDYDLPLHPVDLWTYDHHTRLGVRTSLADELARGPESAADAFEASGRARLPLLLDDVASRGLGHVPAVVEGPHLMPVFAGPVAAGWAVWLVPDESRTRAARMERLAREESLAAGAAPGRPRIEALLRRDALLAARIRATARRAGWPVIEVPAVPHWPGVAVRLKRTLGAALTSAPRLRPGAELARQRRFENEAAVRQVRMWASDAGFGSLPAFPFACECGTSRCRATWLVTPDEYDTHARRGPVVTHPGPRAAG